MFQAAAGFLGSALGSLWADDGKMNKARLPASLAPNRHGGRRPRGGGHKPGARRGRGHPACRRRRRLRRTAALRGGARRGRCADGRRAPAARAATSAADYERVYRARCCPGPCAPDVLHWLGAAFDPELARYFGPGDVPTASTPSSGSSPRTPRSKPGHQDEPARRGPRDRGCIPDLPRGTTLFTGDDFDYIELHRGRRTAAFRRAARARFALVAARRLRSDPGVGGRRRPRGPTLPTVLEPTEALARHVFAAPTYYYKTGVAFLAWLNQVTAPALDLGWLFQQPYDLLRFGVGVDPVEQLRHVAIARGDAASDVRGGRPMSVSCVTRDSAEEEGG